MVHLYLKSRVTLSIADFMTYIKVLQTQVLNKQVIFGLGGKSWQGYFTSHIL